MDSTQKSSLRQRFELRLDNETSEDLQYCSEKLKVSKTAVVKMGIKKVKEDVKKID